MTAFEALALGLVLTWPLVWIAAWGARRLGFVDLPAVRKVHLSAVPDTGGYALVLGLLVGGAAVGAFHVAWVVPALLAFLVGALDDRGRLGKVAKLGLQLLVCVAAVALGLRLGTDTALDPLLTGVVLLLVMQVINFLDGIDLITCAVTFVLLMGAAAHGAGPADGLLYACAAGGVLAVAWWNVTPARVFLGDGGTHVLGFLVGASVLTHEASGTQALPVTWLLAAMLPAALDIAWGMLSKRRLGIGWTDPHRAHLYQRLVRAGWSPVFVALRYALLTTIGLALAAWGAPRWGVLAALGIGALVLAIHVAHGGVVAGRVATLEREDDR